MLPSEREPEYTTCLPMSLIVRPAGSVAKFALLQRLRLNDRFALRQGINRATTTDSNRCIAVIQFAAAISWIGQLPTPDGGNPPAPPPATRTAAPHNLSSASSATVTRSPRSGYAVSRLSQRRWAPKSHAALAQGNVVRKRHQAKRLCPIAG